MGGRRAGPGRAVGSSSSGRKCRSSGGRKCCVQSRPGLGRRAGEGSAPQGPPGRGGLGRRQLGGGGQADAGDSDWSAYWTRTKTLDSELRAAGAAGAAPARAAGAVPMPGQRRGRGGRGVAGSTPAPSPRGVRRARLPPVGAVRPAGGCGCNRTPSAAARPERGRGPEGGRKTERNVIGRASADGRSASTRLPAWVGCLFKTVYGPQHTCPAIDHITGSDSTGSGGS